MAERVLGMRARRLLLTVAGIVLSIATAHRYWLFCAMENGFGPQGQADGLSAGTCEHPRRSIGVVSRAEARIEAADRELAAVPHAHNQSDGSAANAAAITTMNLPSAPATKMKRSANQPVVMMAQEPGGVYERAAAGRFDPAVKGALDRVYVPNVLSNSVDVIDPKTLIVIDQFEAGASPQHVVPSWDLRTLWVAGSKVRHGSGSLTPVDPMTGRPGKRLDVPDAYNMYFTPDGHSAIVVAESLERLEFRDPQTMALRALLPVPECRGINHADFSMDGRYAIFSCEFNGTLAKIDVAELKVLGTLRLSKGGMPQDVRISPDGKIFYVADMLADGVFLINGDEFVETGFIPTGGGAHGLYPSRDATQLYVSNRGSHHTPGKREGPGSISAINFAARTVQGSWPIPGGGVLTWVMSVPMEKLSGSQVAMTTWCMPSTRRRARPPRSQSGASRMA